MTSYDITVFREEDLWVADIPELVAATDMFRFADLDVEVRDLISLLTDVEPESFDLQWHYLAGTDDVTELIEGPVRVETDIEQATTRRDSLRKQIITRMSMAGLSQRAIGDVLGLSHQRVHQLARS